MVLFSPGVHAVKKIQFWVSWVFLFVASARESKGSKSKRISVLMVPNRLIEGSARFFAAKWIWVSVFGSEVNISMFLCQAICSWSVLARVIRSFTCLTFSNSKLPYDVTPEQALSHEEVRTRLDASIRNMRTVTDKFLSAIISSVDKIPWVWCTRVVPEKSLVLLASILFDLFFLSGMECVSFPRS